MTTMINDYSNIDWANWHPQENATLLFVMDRDQILLIRKKRGLGAGKINGPGGRVEGSETFAECAVRETREELGIDALSPQLRGRHRFQFCDGYALQVFVYQCNKHRGTAIETDEAIPLWTPVNNIPYEEMWEDDRIWLPMMLDGKCFDGSYLFDQDKMLDYELNTIDDPDKLLP